MTKFRLTLLSILVLLLVVYANYFRTVEDAYGNVYELSKFSQLNKDLTKSPVHKQHSFTILPENKVDTFSLEKTYHYLKNIKPDFSLYPEKDLDDYDNIIKYLSNYRLANHPGIRYDIYIKNDYSYVWMEFRVIGLNDRPDTGPDRVNTDINSKFAYGLSNCEMIIDTKSGLVYFTHP